MFVLLLFFLAINNPVHSQSLITLPLDKFANATLECVNHLIKKQLGSSIMRVDDFTAEVPIMFLKGTYTFRRNFLSGLDKLQMEKMSAGLYRPDLKKPQLSIEFSLLLPLNFKSDYDFDGRIADIVAIKGHGELDLSLGIRLYGEIVVTAIYQKDRLKVEKLLLIPELVPKIQIGGLSVGEKISKLVGKQLDSIIEVFVNVDSVRFFMQDLFKIVKSAVNLILRPKLSESLQMLFDFRDQLSEQCPGIPQITEIEHLYAHTEL